MNKRKRSYNFSYAEKELLLKIALPRRKVLENKTSNAVTWKHKENAWKEIATQFNSQTPESPRSTTCLKQKYDNIKKKMRVAKTQLLETGDDQQQKHLTELELELFNTIQAPDEEIKLDSSIDIKQLDKCDTLTSDNISILKQEKINLVFLQKELVKQKLEQGKELHKLKMKHVHEEHELRMMVLQYECNII